jgi:hypothetical protein
MGRLYLRTLLTVAILLLSSNAANAETFVPAQITPEQLLQKADAAEGGLQLGRYVILEQSKDAGISTAIVTRIDGQDTRTTERSGNFRVAYGRYKGRTWEQDENGMVRYETRPSKIADALASPGKPDGVVRLLGLTSGPAKEYVLDVHPSASDEELRYYDARTFLLDRIVTKYVKRRRSNRKV